uniref:Uncharacterized protein n=1 Tax=Bracon brevicornis TaxID=1563983 RepID=A0A6V7J8C1_9HYME
MKVNAITVCNKVEVIATRRAKVTLLALKKFFSKVKWADHKIKAIDEQHISTQKGAMVMDEAEARNIVNENMENERREMLSGGNQ